MRPASLAPPAAPASVGPKRHASLMSSKVSEKFSEIERRWLRTPSPMALNVSLTRSLKLLGGSGSSCSWSAVS